MTCERCEEPKPTIYVSCWIGAPIHGRVIIDADLCADCLARLEVCVSAFLLSIPKITT